jgi:hypothetical protein
MSKQLTHTDTHNMATTYQTSVCHPVPNLEPSVELISAATHAWGILYAQPNKVRTITLLPSFLHPTFIPRALLPLCPLHDPAMPVRHMLLVLRSRARPPR